MKSCNSGPSVCPGRPSRTPHPFNPTRHSQVRESGSGLINSLLCVKYATFTFPGLIIIPRGSATSQDFFFSSSSPPRFLFFPFRRRRIHFRLRVLTSNAAALTSFRR